ncbi:MAG: hypothetical protein J4F45_08250 [Pseudomonadales bacterium]|nr:hypothetical protein [Pseudomonadales bacterium]
MLNRKMKPIALAVGAAFAASVAGNVAADGVDPFEASLLEDGVLIATSHKEGGCGEDKEKSDGDEAKCGEGKCGEEGDSEEGDSEEGDEEESEESEEE